MDPDPHPDPDPDQSDKLDQEVDTHQFADDKPKRMEYEPTWANFQGILSLYVGAGIWIWIRSRIRIRLK